MTPDELKGLIAQREGTRLDFKRNLSDDSYQNLPKDFAAFSNADGGYILVGVDDDGEILGADWNADKTARVQQEGARCNPKIQPSIASVSVPRKGTVWIIEIPRSTSIHQDEKQKFPYRIGNTTIQMDAALILAVAKTKGLITDSGLTQVGINAVSSEPKRLRGPGRIQFLNEYLVAEKVSVRAEALKDLGQLSYTFAVERLPGFDDRLLDMLNNPDYRIRLQTLHMLGSLFSRGKSTKRRNLRLKVIPIIEKLAMVDSDTNVRNRAIYLLCEMNSPNAIQTILDVMKTEPDKSYQNLGVTNGFRDLVQFGRGYETVRRLFEELAKTHSAEMESRIVAAMDFLRNMSWAK